MMSWKDKKPKKGDQKPESSREWQPIDEDSFGKLHVDYALRNAFMESEPMSQERYESLYFHEGSGPGAYFIPPPYEDYLRLFSIYKNKGVYSPSEGEDELQPLNEEAFRKLQVDDGLRGAFMYREPLSRWWYEIGPRWRYEREDSTHNTTPPTYEEYHLLQRLLWLLRRLLRWHARRSTSPPYEEYLRLFEKYQSLVREQERWSEFYRANTPG